MEMEGEEQRSKEGEGGEEQGGGSHWERNEGAEDRLTERKVVEGGRWKVR